MAGIYIIENNVNGMVYVGKSKAPYMRFKEHMAALKKGIHHNWIFQNDFNKYGENSFSFMQIEECSDKEAFKKEADWTNYFRRFNVAPIYNDLRTNGNVGQLLKRIR